MTDLHLSDQHSAFVMSPSGKGGGRWKRRELLTLDTIQTASRRMPWLYVIG